MSILIKGMEMPERDERYTLMLYGDGRVFVYKREQNPSFIGGRVTSWTGVHASARKLPPHGRLIDADTLMEYTGRERLDSRERITQMINIAPTIIAAEK